ncbi:MAG: CDP-glycerol glycerophosphotransferase family protein [Endomicrobiaceae bacterium]|nr:CDP-glycerol glycerophosphotransferase family protein [Endomicrobiaceae bacterium]
MVAPAFAYIDPATGSMLFSVIIGIVATVFFLLKSVFYKLYFVLTGYNKELKNSYIPIVLYNEGKKYDICFEPLLDEFEKRKVSVVYYTSEKDDLLLNKKYEYIKSEFIGKDNKAYMKLSLLQADICVMTTPGLDVYQLKRSKYVKNYCHIFHGIGDHCDYRLFGLDYYDSLMIINEINGTYIREIEKKRNLKQKELVVSGSLDMDKMSEKIKLMPKEKKDKFTILIAPTWGPQAIFSKYGTAFIEELLKKDWNIIIRPHPQSLISEKKLIEEIKNKYTGNKNIIWDDNVNNLISLNKADILISDFSGIIFDYAFIFNKPFIYTEYEQKREIYDYSDLGHDTWKTEVLKEIGFELKKEDITKIADIINKVAADKEKIKNIEKIKNFIWQKQGQSAQIITDYIIAKQKKVSD